MGRRVTGLSVAEARQMNEARKNKVGDVLMDRIKEREGVDARE